MNRPPTDRERRRSRRIRRLAAILTAIGCVVAAAGLIPMGVAVQRWMIANTPTIGGWHLAAIAIGVGLAAVGLLGIDDGE